MRCLVLDILIFFLSSIELKFTYRIIHPFKVHDSLLGF